MLFDLEAHEASIPVAPPVPANGSARSPSNWLFQRRIGKNGSQIVCCAKMAEAKTGDIVSVPSVQHGGYLHCAFSALYGGMTSNYIVDAWQLVPSDLFDGEKRTYVDHTDYDESGPPLAVTALGCDCQFAVPRSSVRALSRSFAPYLQ